MSDTREALAVPLSPAATVMLVRDAAAGPDGSPVLEVFMLRRAVGASFAGGAYVFPGGRVDAVDRGGALEAVCDDLDDRRASARLGVGRGGLAYWVAAVRECFEEAGVLLARPSTGGDAIRFDDPATGRRFGAARRAVHRGELSLVELCVREELVLITGLVQYVSHWITPVGEPKRFDTRFFLALAPPGQEPLHDDTETIASLWITPHDALAAAAAGDLQLLPPTIRSLEFLAEHASADSALAAAAAIEEPPAILPRLRLDTAGRVRGVVLPGEADYAAVPVPTTVVRDRR